MFSLSIKVNKTGVTERYDVDLKNVDGHVVTPYDPPSLARVLDVVFSADQKADLNTGNLMSRPDPDNNVEVCGVLRFGFVYSTNTATLLSLLFAGLWPARCSSALRLQMGSTDRNMRMTPRLMSLLNSSVTLVKKPATCFIVYSMRHTNLPI